MTDINSIIEMIEEVKLNMDSTMIYSKRRGYELACDDIIEQLREMSEWRDMSEAPEDEYILLIEAYDKVPFVGYKKKGSWFENIMNAEVVGDAYIKTAFDPMWLVGWQHLPKPPNSKEL